MPKVFITNDTGHDYSPAKYFGELIFMTKGLVPRTRISLMLRTFNEYLKESTSKDYILQSGPSVLNSIACALFAAKHKKLNLLLYIGDKYIVRSIDFLHFLGVKKDEKGNKKDGAKST